MVVSSIPVPGVWDHGGYTTTVKGGDKLRLICYVVQRKIVSLIGLIKARLLS